MLRQVSFFITGGKARMPAPGDSCDTARELARYLLRLEQGRRVDVLSSTEITPDLRDRNAHPLCIGTGAGRRGGVLQIGLSVPVRARSRVQVRAVCRQGQELHELGDGRRVTGAGSRAVLHQHAGHEHLAQ